MGWLLDGVAVALLTALPLIVRLRVRIEGPDEGILLLNPELMRLGLEPNRDFFTVYGPNGYRLLEAVYAVSGPGLVPERLVGVAYFVAIAVGVLVLVGRRDRGAGLAAGALSGLVASWAMPMAFAWTGGLALLVWAMVAVDIGGKWGGFVGGLLAGLAMGFRYEFIALALALVPLVRRSTVRTVLFGAALGALPLLVHLIQQPTWVWRDVAGRFGLNARQETSPLDWLTGGTIIVGVAAAVLVLAALLRRRDAQLARAAAVFAVVSLPQALQRVDYYHSMFVGVFTLPLAVSVAWGLRRGLADSVVLPRISRQVVGSVVLGMSVAVGILWAQQQVHEVHVADRRLFAAPALSDEITKVTDAVVSVVHPGARLFVGATDMALPTANQTYYYFLLPQFPPSGRFTELAPGDSERSGSGLVMDIKRADVLILTEFDEGSVRQNYPHIPLGSNEADRAVREGFTCVAQFDFTQVWVAARSGMPGDAECRRES